MTQAVLQTKVTEMPIALGIDNDRRAELADGLKTTLTAHYRLMFETQILHWNVAGPLFYSIHNLTESQYTKAFEAIDSIAERIRALGMPAPRDANELLGDMVLYDFKADALDKQLANLIRSNERLVRNMRDLTKLAESASDIRTADLLTDRIGELEEAIWMLRATTTDNA
ncbi:MAG: DNA starvation/stationary phase protection protein [Pseudomonadota bacterium]